MVKPQLLPVYWFNCCRMWTGTKVGQPTNLEIGSCKVTRKEFWYPCIGFEVWWQDLMEAHAGPRCPWRGCCTASSTTGWLNQKSNLQGCRPTLILTKPRRKARIQSYPSISSATKAAVVQHSRCSYLAHLAATERECTFIKLGLYHLVFGKG